MQQPAISRGFLRLGPLLSGLGLLFVVAIPVARAVGQGGAARAKPPRHGALALRVGTIHPVAGPDIRDGVILIRGDRIVAVGPAEKVEIPAGVKVIAYPRAHAYPGLVDALSSAFATARVLGGATDAGTRIADGLDRFDRSSRELAAAGITTVYVGGRGAGTWHGQGVVLRPTPDGYEILGKDSAAVEMGISAGAGATHALARQKALRGIGKPFAALAAYKKAKKDHKKKLKDYEKTFAAYLAYHRKRAKDKKAKPKGTRPERGEARTPGRRAGRFGRGRGGRGRPGQGRGGRPGTPPSGKPPTGKPPDGKKATPAQGKPASPPASGAKKAAEPKAPKRPKFPSAFKVDPSKEALLAVQAGDLALRLEARRPDEIEAALRLSREQKIPRLVLENATSAAPLAAELARAGVPVVLSDLLPEPVAAHRRKIDANLAGQLAAAGVAIAIASGSTRAARDLPLLAAFAVGHGLSREQAILALTLSPARILGVGRKVGSLEPGKLADVLITSGPLLSSDTKMLRVLQSGNTRFEAKR